MNLMSLTIGGMCLISGASMVIFPKRKREAMLARKAKLAAGTSERYFEERRAIEAYPPPKTDKGWRIKGIALALLGVAAVCIGIYR